MFTGSVLLFERDEVGYVVAEGTLSGDIGDEAFGSGDPRFVEHSVEFLAGVAYEGFAGGFLVSTGSFAHNHNPRRDWPCRTDLDGHGLGLEGLYALDGYSVGGRVEFDSYGFALKTMCSRKNRPATAERV